jgi:hypothetical protein
MPLADELLSGLIECGECGHAYCSARRYFKFVRPSGHISVYHRAAYRCTRGLNDYAHDPEVVAPCRNSMVETHILDAKIVDLIRDTLLDPEKLRSCIQGGADLPQDEGRESEWIAAELRQLDEDRRQLQKLYATGKMSKTRYVGASRAIDEMLERLKSEQELAARTKRGATPNTVSMSRLRQFCATARSRFESCADLEAKRRFMREYVGPIVFNRGKVVIIGSLPAHNATSEPTVQYRIVGEIDRTKVRLKASRMLWRDERLTSWVPEKVAV